MEMLIELMPILAFFIVFEVAKHVLAVPDDAIYWATATAIVLSVLQIGWLLLRRKPIKKMQWFSLALISIMGGLTIYLQNKSFIYWKPTLLDWGFAATMLGSSLIYRKNLIRQFLEKQLQDADDSVNIPDHVWSRLNIMWIVFFIVMGVVNLLVSPLAGFFSEETWVVYKTFSLVISVAFSLGSVMWLSRYFPEKAEKGTG